MCSNNRARTASRKPVFLTMRETADLLGIKRGSLKHYRSNRPDKTPPSTKQGRLVAYELDVVLAWAAENRPLDLGAIRQRAEALR